MKPISLFLAGTMLLLASCSEEINNTTESTAEPGTYIVGINLNMEVPLTKGIIHEADGVFSFDTNYSYDNIYLHTQSDCISIPVSVNEACGEGCKGFTYKILIDESGQATLTPINSDGNESGPSIEIAQNEQVYFSSSEDKVWTATPSEAKVPHDLSATLYKRIAKKNEELFRSTNDLTAYDLTLGGQLEMERVCTGFTFFCLFTDREDNNLTASDFEDIMGATYDKFTIKIYIGGPAFTDEYNISNKAGNENAPDGYYASGNSFTNEGDYGNMDAVPLRGEINSNLGYGPGYGYATYEGNELITPINDEKTINAYIYITHEDKTIYTEYITDISFREGNFYRVGADIDIRELAAAFDNYEHLSSAASTDTRSASAPRLFTPKSLVTHIEY